MFVMIARNIVSTDKSPVQDRPNTSTRAMQHKCMLVAAKNAAKIFRCRFMMRLFLTCLPWVPVVLAFDSTAEAKIPACPKGTENLQILVNSKLCKPHTLEQFIKFVKSIRGGRVHSPCQIDGKLLLVMWTSELPMVAWDYTTNKGYKTCNGQLMPIDRQ